MSGTAQSSASAQQALAQEQINNAIVATSFRQWLRMQCVSTPGPTWTYALNSPGVEFQLKSANRSVLAIRIKLTDIPLTVTPGTGTVGMNPYALAGLLGSLKVQLGNIIYQFPASLIPLMLRTFQAYGTEYWYAGRVATADAYDYTPKLYGTISAATGTWTGWIDLPMAWLLPTNDSLGVSPTMSGSPLSLIFDTPQTLAGTDPVLFPFYTTGAGAVTLTGATGVVEAFVLTMTGISPAGSSSATPNGVVGTPAFGSGIEIRERSIVLQTGESLSDYFVRFQEGTGQKELLKSIIILDNPGQVNGEYSVNTDFTKVDLMFDADQPAVEYNSKNNSQKAAFVDNFFIDQRKMYGDLPGGVLVFDFLSGTDPRFPNNYHAHFNLSQKPDAGVLLSYTGSMNSGARVRVLNMYGRTNLYTAQPA